MMNSNQTSAMSISAITTAPIFPPSPPPSASSTASQSSYYHPEAKFHHRVHQASQLEQLRSPPTSPEDMSPPSSPQFSSSDLHGMAPLTLQERRLRNKAASAKYRQKKNQQQNEMRQMICRLSEQNAVLDRQLQELRMENERLRASADRLRGKMVAKKMLRQWIGRHHRKDSSSSTAPSSSAFQAVSKKNHHYHPYANDGEVDLDLDFDDDDVCLDD